MLLSHIARKARPWCFTRVVSVQPSCDASRSVSSFFRESALYNGCAHRWFSSPGWDEEGKLVVAILGPPNAGKSTLFNRLMCKEANKSYRLTSEKKPRNRGSIARIGYSKPSTRAGGAIVSTTPGTTRDRRECVGRIGGTTFSLVDTAGVDGEKLLHLVGKPEKHPPLARNMIQQTQEAAKGADLVLLLFDARAGVTSDLMETAKWLRSLNSQAFQLDADPADEHETQSVRNVVILANKLEGDKWTDADSPVLDHLAEASRVGFGEPIPISAYHGDGLADVAVVVDRLTARKKAKLGIEDDPLLEDSVPKKRQPMTDEEKAKMPLQLAILGRQNVGKSTLVNALLKQERVITGEVPGLTRDAISVNWTWKGKKVNLVDTAGIRKAIQRASQPDDIEDKAVQDAMRAMRVADVAVLVLDAGARMLLRQELAIADAVVKEGRALVVAANKMDLMLEDDYTRKQFTQAVCDQIEGRLPMLRQTPVVAMSALSGDCVEKLMPVVFNARKRWSQTIPTGVLNRWLSEVLIGQAPPPSGGRETKIKYMMQTKGRPPTFLLFANTDELPDTYLRYLTRNFQDTFQMFGMEVRLAVKKSAAQNPFGRVGGKRGGGHVGGREKRKQRIMSQLISTGKVTKKGKRRRWTKRRRK